jgi:2-C-methyl-D-erythritol 4-phosphate cytidylyltransferase
LNPVESRKHSGKLARAVALIPAAGVGERAGSAAPKQFAHLNGEPMLAHTVRAFARCSAIEKIAIVVAPGMHTQHEHALKTLGTRASSGSSPAQFSDVAVLPVGGATRAASVLNGLRALNLPPDTWVLVHDAARPCITAAMITSLIEELNEDAVGGLLAIPVADTVKRADAEHRVAATVPRDALWLAQTPQMFKAGLLSAAYQTHTLATDEAGAIEAAGHAPRLVRGSARNIKVTWPDDFALAERYLKEAQ